MKSTLDMQILAYLNYRPISVISVVAKVFEKITYNQAYAYLSEHNLHYFKKSIRISLYPFYGHCFTRGDR